MNKWVLRLVCDPPSDECWIISQRVSGVVTCTPSKCEIMIYIVGPELVNKWALWLVCDAPSGACLLISQCVSGFACELSVRS